MPKYIKRRGSEIPYAEINESPMLVDPAKSRRFREMLNGRNVGVQIQPNIAAVAVESENSIDLPADVVKELLRARHIIDDEIDRIMSFLPEGRKNSLFKLRFGTLEEIRVMEIQAIFKLLKLDTGRMNLNRLQKISYYGEKVT